MSKKSLKQKKLLWDLFCHDIKNKLSTAIGFADLIEKKQELEHLPVVKKALESMENIMELYNQFMQISQMILTIEQITDKVNEMLEETIRIRIEKNQDSIKLNNLFVAVFYNLIQNSLEHSGCSRKDLRIIIKFIGGNTIIFTDNGKGIEDKDKIFASPGHALHIIGQIGKEVLGFSIKETGTHGARFEIEFI